MQLNALADFDPEMQFILFVYYCTDISKIILEGIKSKHKFQYSCAMLVT